MLLIERPVQFDRLVAVKSKQQVSLRVFQAVLSDCLLAQNICMHCESGMLTIYRFFLLLHRAFKGAGQHTDGFYMIKLGKYRYETGFAVL